MSDTNSIDSLQLRITSDSAKAEESLDRLTESLKRLKGGLEGLDEKSSGLKSFANSLKRLGSVTKTYNPSSLNRILDSMKGIIDASSNMSSITTFVKSINSIIRSTDKIKSTSEVFPTLSNQMKEFFESMSNMDISDNTVRMAEAFVKISRNGSRASDSLDRVNMSTGKGVPLMQSLSKGADALVGSLKKIGGGALNGLKNLALQISGLNRSNSGISNLTFNLKNLLATVIGFRGITGLFNWTKESIKAGADLTEIDHIVESVFGEDMIGYVQDWADNALEAFGIASTAAKQYAGTMSAMFQASNVGVKESNKMAMDLVGLAGDLSAFFNIDTETAYNKLKSGMAGMVRPLRDLGIDISAATLKEYALAQGIEKSYSAMTQGEKMLLRYKYLMEQTSLQQGDFSRTSKSLANSLRILRAYASEVATQIGAGLASALRHAIVWLNGMMKHVLKAAQAFSTFMQTLFGKYKGSAKGAMLDGSLLDAEESAGDLADSAGDAAGNLLDADEAAKKLKKDLAVLPFDELNQLAKDMETTSSTPKGSSGGVGGIGDIGDFGEGVFGDAIDNVESKLGELATFLSRWAQLIKGYFNAGNWEGLGMAIAWGFNKGIAELYRILDPAKAREKINAFIDPFVTTFNSFVDHIHWDELGGSIGRGITILSDAFNRLTDPKTGIDFENIGKSIATLMNNAIKETNWTSVGEAISNGFMVGWRIFKGWVDEFDATEAGTAVRDAIGGAIEKMEPKDIGASLGKFVTKAANFISETFKDKKQWKTLGEKIGDGIAAFFDELKGEDLADAANAIADAILTALNAILEKDEWKNKAGEDFETFFKNLKWSTIGLAAGIAFGPALIGGILAGIKSGLVAKVASAVEGIKAMGLGSFLVTAMTYASPAMLGKTADDLWSLLEGALEKTRVGRTIIHWDDAIFGNFQTFLHETLPQKFSEFGENTKELIKSIFSFEHTKEAWDEAVENFKKGGTNIGEGILNGIDAAVSFIFEPIQNFFDAVLQAFCDVFGIHSPATETEFIGENIILGIIGGIQSKFEDLTLAIQGIPPLLFEAAGDAYEWLKTKGSDAIEGIRGGWDSVKDSDLLSEAAALGSNVFESIGSIGETVKQKGSDIIEGIRSGWDDVKESRFFEVVSKFSGNVYDKIGDIKSKVKQKGKDIIGGVRSGYDLVANSDLFNKLSMFRGDVFEKIGNVYDKVKPKGENIIGGIKSGYNKMIEDFLKLIGKLPDRILKSVGDFSILGAGLMEDFADGLESMMDFPSPHIGWDWTGPTLTIGNWEWTLPEFSVDWYAKGGLFTKATIAGFGEAGDEAALPLENRQTMNRIARAIVDNSGSAFGMTEDQLASAVARGYVQAMMSNQGNERPIDVYATLYTEDNEVLARAVQRGNQSIDFRNNPTTRIN